MRRSARTGGDRGRRGVWGGFLRLPIDGCAVAIGPGHPHRGDRGGGIGLADGEIMRQPGLVASAGNASSAARGTEHKEDNG
jgi:hypothetical protein